MSTTIREALQAARRRLSPSSPSPRLDAELLLGHALGRPREYLHTWPERDLAQREQVRFERLLERREAGEPIAYLTGEREFWSMTLHVVPGVLIPRPETELLVELLLEHLPADRPAQVADLGTGSGAIALALARERPGWNILATDRSSETLAIARENATRLGIGRIDWRLGAWFEPLAGLRFDAIVSNPPYVASDDPHLAQDDVRFEPSGAFDGGPDGLDELRSIIEGSPAHLKPGGWLVLEHGCDQGPAVRALLQTAGLGDIRTHCDLAGLERATIARQGDRVGPAGEA
jgi:release factor glutamine methyltransferase